MHGGALATVENLGSSLRVGLCHSVDPEPEPGDLVSQGHAPPSLPCLGAGTKKIDSSAQGPRVQYQILPLRSRHPALPCQTCMPNRALHTKRAPLDALCAAVAAASVWHEYARGGGRLAGQRGMRGAAVVTGPFGIT